MQVTTKSLAETEKAAQKFMHNLTPNGTLATVVGLFGDLGSGKTTFTQALARSLNVKEVVTSPTFVIEKIYKLDRQVFSRFIHIDAYRLESGKELLGLGWREILEDPKNLIVIEWPERVLDVLPLEIKKVEFEFVDDITRRITLE